jgi:hypothetical protein
VSERAVLDIIRSSAGVTDDDIERLSGLRHQSVSARRNALVRKGLVCDSGERRKTRSGWLAVVWIFGTGRPLDGAPNDRPPRPTNAEIREAEAHVGSHYGYSDSDDGRIFEPESVKKLRRWLQHIAKG